MSGGGGKHWGGQQEGAGTDTITYWEATGKPSSLFWGGGSSSLPKLQCGDPPGPSLLPKTFSLKTEGQDAKVK